MTSREESRRSRSFLEGAQILLADGNTWTLPAAAALLAHRMPAQASDDLASLVDGINYAERVADLRKSELALAVFLLTWNYEFEVGELASLLSYAPGSPLRESSHQAFHAVAIDYIQQLSSAPRGSREVSAASKVGWWARCWRAVQRSLLVPMSVLLHRPQE